MYVVAASTPLISIRGHSILGLQDGRRRHLLPSHSGGGSSRGQGRQGNSTVPHHALPEPRPGPVRVYGHDAKPSCCVGRVPGQCPSGPRAIPICPIPPAVYPNASRVMYGRLRSSVPAERLLHHPLVGPVFGSFWGLGYIARVPPPPLTHTNPWPITAPSLPFSFHSCMHAY